MGSKAYSDKELGKMINMLLKGKSFIDVSEALGRPEFGVYLKSRNIKIMLSERIKTGGFRGTFGSDYSPNSFAVTEDHPFEVDEPKSPEVKKPSFLRRILGG
tara:strand:- start:294 stop:599 length:306 start_codon:yes stop_codon:yes gene_type:complete